MNDRSTPGYGTGLWEIGREDLRDSLRGRSVRVYARHGLLKPPSGSGKLIWVKAGGSRESVLVATDLLHAIRSKRLDVRLALTFERDYPRLVRKRLRGIAKAGLGYGPCDVSRVVQRVLDRLEPLGVIIVRHAPPNNLMRAIKKRGIHSVAINVEPSHVPLETVYPVSRDQVAAWRKESEGVIAAPADLLTLLVEAQVDPTFRSVATGGEGNVWWFQTRRWSQAMEMIQAWRSWGVPEDLLFVGNGDAQWRSAAARGLGASLYLWDRKRFSAGSVVFVDDRKWLPALTASCDATYLASPTDLEFWQAVAGGGVVSAAPGALFDRSDAAGLIDRVPTVGELLGRWRYYARDVVARRRRGDALRRFFWEERRRAADVADDLLNRIYEW